MPKSSSKKILLYSDLHCGSETGITPLKYISDDIGIPGLSDLRRKFWKWFVESLREFGRFDVAVCNGDLVDGNAEKDKGIHSHTTNIKTQQQMAIDVLKQVNTKKHFIVRGTKYHVANIIEAEDAIADEVKATIDNVIKFECYGKIFKVKHKGTRGGVPHSGTPKLGKRVWDIVNAYIAGENVPYFTIRSHAHEYFYAKTDYGVYIQTPCMQLAGRSAYGRGIDGLYSVGFVVVEMFPDGSYSTHDRFFKINREDSRVLKI